MNFSSLFKANFFNSGLFSFVGSNSTLKTLLATKILFETTTIETLIETTTTEALTSFHSIAFSIILSNMKTYKNEYKYLNIIFELSTIHWKAL